MDAWAERMRKQGYTVIEPGDTVSFDRPLLDGQHRLQAVLRYGAVKAYRRRRRMWQVATRKYRARGRR